MKTKVNGFAVVFFVLMYADGYCQTSVKPLFGTEYFDGISGPVPVTVSDDVLWSNRQKYKDYKNSCRLFDDREYVMCNMVGSCIFRCGKNASRQARENIQEMCVADEPTTCLEGLCACDKWCVFAGDCCGDFKYHCQDRFHELDQIRLSIKLTTKCENGYNVIRGCSNKTEVKGTGRNQYDPRQTYLTHVESGITVGNSHILQCVFGETSARGQDVKSWISTISSLSELKITPLNLFFWSGNAKMLEEGFLNVTFNSPPNDFSGRRKCLPSVLMHCRDRLDIGECKKAGHVQLPSIKSACPRIQQSPFRDKENLGGEVPLGSNLTTFPWTRSTTVVTTTPSPDKISDHCYIKQVLSEIPSVGHLNETQLENEITTTTLRPLSGKNFGVRFYNVWSWEKNRLETKILDSNINDWITSVRCISTMASHEGCILDAVCVPGYIFLRNRCRLPDLLHLQFVGKTLKKIRTQEIVAQIKFLLRQKFSPDLFKSDLESMQRFKLKKGNLTTETIIAKMPINFINAPHLRQDDQVLPFTEELLMRKVNNDLNHLAQLFVCLQILEKSNSKGFLVCDGMSISQSNVTEIKSFNMYGSYTVPRSLINFHANPEPDEIIMEENSACRRHLQQVNVLIIMFAYILMASFAL